VHIQRGGRSVASAKSYLPKFALDEDDDVYHDDDGEYTEAEKENVDSNLDFLSSHASSASASSSLMPRHRYPPELSPIHSP
jgi:hypothetical protein